MKAPYVKYSQYLTEKYGEKVYKIPINIPSHCPNRDGTKGYGGCIFCAEDGSGHENMSQHTAVALQYDAMRQLLQRKYRAKKYIAYLQSFSNTYLPYQQFERYLHEIAQLRDCVAVAVATRPDCVEERHIRFLRDLCKTYGVDISVELGLQSANEETLKILNRRHTVADVVKSAQRVKEAGLELCLHVISNLPWDERKDVVATAKLINRLNADTAKLHTLYIAKGTALEKMYLRGEVRLLSLEETIERTILLLEHLAPTVALQRIVSRVTEEKSVFCNWHLSWRKVLKMIEEEMRSRESYQAKAWTNMSDKTIRADKDVN